MPQNMHKERCIKTYSMFRFVTYLATVAAPIGHASGRPATAAPPAAQERPADLSASGFCHGRHSLLNWQQEQVTVCNISICDGRDQLPILSLDRSDFAKFVLQCSHQPVVQANMCTAFMGACSCRKIYASLYVENIHRTYRSCSGSQPLV